MVQKGAPQCRINNQLISYYVVNLTYYCFSVTTPFPLFSWVHSLTVSRFLMILSMLQRILFVSLSVFSNRFRIFWYEILIYSCFYFVLQARLRIKKPWKRTKRSSINREVKEWNEWWCLILSYWCMSFCINLFHSSVYTLHLHRIVVKSPVIRMFENYFLNFFFFFFFLFLPILTSSLKFCNNKWKIIYTRLV